MIILRTKTYKQESNIEGLIIVLRLALMMFLQYMMFAVWWVPLAAYLTNMGIDRVQKSLVLNSMAIGCIADRSDIKYITSTDRIF